MKVFVVLRDDEVLVDIFENEERCRKYLKDKTDTKWMRYLGDDLWDNWCDYGSQGHCSWTIEEWEVK